MDTQMIFERYEMKYLLTEKQREQVLHGMRDHMEPDRFGHSTIRNIYYDTYSYRLIRESLEKPVYKEKLRVRSYRTVRGNEEVFVELKKKLNDVVYKRRVAMSRNEAMWYLAGGEPPFRSQIISEIDYLKRYYEPLQPKVFLSYEREAYFAPETPVFRVTFDENILCRESDLSLGKGIYGTPLLAPGICLMEIKTGGAIPLWFVRILSENGIGKCSFSKYGEAYRSLMEAARPTSRDNSTDPRPFAAADRERAGATDERRTIYA